MEKRIGRSLPAACPDRSELLRVGEAGSLQAVDPGDPAGQSEGRAGCYSGGAGESEKAMEVQTDRNPSNFEGATAQG